MRDSFELAIELCQKHNYFGSGSVTPSSDNMGALDTGVEFEQLSLTDIQHATHNKMAVSFDWLEFTIQDVDFKQVMLEILDLDIVDFVQLDKGGRGYKQSYIWSGGNVRIFFDGAENMGVHVSMTGDGCRAYFTKKNPRLLVLRIKQYRGTFSRIDCAVDDICAKFFSVQDIIDFAKNNEIISKWRNMTIRQEFSISALDKTSDIVYFGSMQSNIYMRVYDKRLEQVAKNTDSDAPLSEWVRWEVVYRDEKADALIEQLINYDFDLGTVVVGVMSYYLRIVERNPLDSNRSRWNISPLWEKFIDSVSKLKLSVIKAERTIDTIKAWLVDQVAPSLCAIMRAEKSLEWIVDMIFKNEFRISPSTKDLIRQYQAVLS